MKLKGKGLNVYIDMEGEKIPHENIQYIERIEEDKNGNFILDENGNVKTKKVYIKKKVEKNGNK